MRQLGKLYAVGTRRSLGIVNQESMTCYKKSRMSKVRILLSIWVELRPIFKLNYLSGLFLVKVFGDKSQGSFGSRQEIKTLLSFTYQPLSGGDITILMLSRPMMGLGSMVLEISDIFSLTNSRSSSRKQKWISRIILRVSFILLYQKRIMRGYVPSLTLRTSEPLCS